MRRPGPERATAAAAAVGMKKMEQMDGGRSVKEDYGTSEPSSGRGKFFQKKKKISPPTQLYRRFFFFRVSVGDHLSSRTLAIAALSVSHSFSYFQIVNQRAAEGDGRPARRRFKLKAGKKVCKEEAEWETRPR